MFGDISWRAGIFRVLRLVVALELCLDWIGLGCAVTGGIAGSLGLCGLDV